jgi:hypothetical protein
MKNKIFLLFLAIFLFGIITAAQPTIAVPQASIGIIIEHPIVDPIIMGQDHEFHFHLFNSTDGKPFYNKGNNIVCIFHLYNSSGNHIFEINNVSIDTDNKYDWEQYVSGKNFSSPGQYGYIFQCNNTAIGGFYEHEIIVNPTGDAFSVPNAILFLFILGLLVTFLYFSINGIKNSVSGAWMVAYVCLSYLAIYLIVGFVFLLSKYYLWTTPLFENIFYIIWFIMGIGFLPFIIIITLYILGHETRAVLEKNYMAQGYSKEDAKNMSKRKR